MAETTDFQQASHLPGNTQWLSGMLGWASRLATEPIEYYRFDWVELHPDQDCLLWRIEYCFDTAISRLEDARFELLKVGGWIEDGDQSFTLADYLGPEAVHYAQGVLLELVDRGNLLWGGNDKADGILSLERAWRDQVNEQIRLVRRRMIQWVPPEQIESECDALLRSCEELGYASDRLRELSEALYMAFGPVERGDPHFRTARWFGDKSRQQIVRQAAQPGRKKKRVESTIDDDGVVRYSARDAHRWWPDMFPNPESESLDSVDSRR